MDIAKEVQGRVANGWRHGKFEKSPGDVLEGSLEERKLRERERNDFQEKQTTGATTASYMENTLPEFLEGEVKDAFGRNPSL